MKYTLALRAFGKHANAVSLITRRHNTLHHQCHHCTQKTRLYNEKQGIKSTTPHIPPSSLCFSKCQTQKLSDSNQRFSSYEVENLATTLGWRFPGDGTMDLETNVVAKLQNLELPAPNPVTKKGLRERGRMEDPDGTLATVARCIELLCCSSSTAQEKENSLKQLLEIINTSDNTFSAVGSHSQAISVLVSLLRSGPLGVKMQAATVLGSLCKENELRYCLGVAFHHCLASSSPAQQKVETAAAKTIYAVSQGGSKDHVRSKIFSTEGVVSVLWQQLQNGLRVESLVVNLLTGALRNLSGSTEGFWPATTEAGGVDILMELLASGDSKTKENVCFLLARVMMEDSSVCPRVLAADATKQLLKLLSPGNEASVRAEAAGALKSLSAQCKEARWELANSNGIPALINATIAPSKEFMQGEHAQALQDNAMCALSNISGGLSYVISSLGESLKSCTSPVQVADTLGALASALMIYDSKAQATRASNPLIIEQILIEQFKPQLPFLVQQHTIEALASLYGNNLFSRKLTNSNAKQLLVGLITMTTNEVQEEIIRSLIILCNNGSLWYALKGRQGVQLLISLLGLSSEQQQECVVALLCLLCNENDESKWAITAAGGIPPLVQILETGSARAKEDSAKILGNLCSHSEDIRACVESADALPALLWLLKYGSQDGKEIAAKTLNHVIHKSDTMTISQLTALLTSDLPESKVYVLDALRSLLSNFSVNDILNEGSSANDAIETIIKMLSSTKEETQVKAASVLAALFACRKDLRESSIAVKAVWSVKKLLNVDSERILIESSFCLASIFLSIKENQDVAAVGRDAFPQLVVLMNSSVIGVAESATWALANMFLDTEISMQAFPEEIIFPATKVLRDGTLDGRTHAAAAIARLVQSRPIDHGLSNSVNCAGTMLELVSLLESSGIEATATSEALDALALLSRLEGASGHVKPVWAVLAEHPHTILPLVSCLASGTPLLQDKAIEILSKLCQDQSGALGNTIASSSGCISSITGRVISSDCIKVKVGGTALLICAVNGHQEKVIKALNDSSFFLNLIRSLVNMINLAHSHVDHDIKDIIISRNTAGQKRCDKTECSTPVILGDTLSIWLLSILACHDDKSKTATVEAEAVNVLTEKTAKYMSQAAKDDFEGGSSTWVCALLLAVLFQDRDIIRSHATMQSIHVLADLLKSRESADRYFAAQALACLACNGSRGTLLAIANSGAASALISMLGCSEANISDLLELSKEFGLACNPELVTLEKLFKVDDTRVGATSRKAIPALVELLKPIPDRPSASSLALGLLTQLAKDSPSNTLMMVEAGSLEALTKYLSLGPQDATEEAAANLLGMLFTSAEIRQHESAYGAVNQLVAVLHLGGRNSRYSAAKALEFLFSSDHIRNEEIAWQAIEPLLEVLNTGLEKEQHAAIAAITRLLCGNPSRILAVSDAEMNVVDVLCQILSSNCSMELKGDAAELCCILFENTNTRSSMATIQCVQPLVSLLLAAFSPAQYSVVCALHKLLDDEDLAELVAAHGAVIPLASLLFGKNYALHESVSRALVKLGKGRPACKMDMVKAGTIERILDVLDAAPNFLCAAFAELLMILTNNTTIAKSSSAAKLVDPLFLLLARSEFCYDGQHSVLQVLVNILEHPQCRAEHSLTPHQVIEPLIYLLDSPNQAVQQLTAELLSHLLLEEYLQKDMITQNAIRPLIQILRSGISILQQGAIKALVSTALTWPNLIVKENGVGELSKIILQPDSSLPHALWESAACVLSSILQFSSEFYLEIPIVVLIRLLHSAMEITVVGALNALLVLERDDATSAEAMVECGAIEALLELLMSHRCEESSARLLEALLNNVKIRETQAARSAILPISQYLLDSQTQAQQARLLTALALGDLFQNEALARSTDAVSACRALVNLLEDQLKEEMKLVVICALQNLVTHSWSNKRAVAEAGGVQVVLDLVSSGDPETSVQAAILVKLIFSNHTLQEYASSETVRAISAVIEKNLCAAGTVNEEYLRALNTLFSSFPRLRATEPATLIIPHLIKNLKAGTEATQEAALDSLYLLRQTCPACPAEVYKVQSVAASEAIPSLQHIIQSGQSRFQEKAEHLLHCLPGTLKVIIKRGNNLKQSVGNPNAYCKLKLANTQPRQTKVLSTGSTPEWNESFAWSFDSPPKGQRLHISCKNKNKMGKSSFGKVIIQINQVVMLGAVSGEYPLLPVSKSGPPRNLEIEFHWSNK
ncbi:LOW QUALITY PROTEIN: C2 calcium-dependent membrane targeting [Cinnamomum micranthum f. kanehirae]|uniref:C2 calcium-dependent membrane targeting n=1 Tax=Cinnamomum micranthum f. kanehirae TaxID=337451 RepID=A0A3S3NIV4_9MAGN|nr:LOW QUALITY PROTEIN: C2 calcium-dependent membrane targeting [Cinnamomum micranthum f. kanehirae]